MGRQRKDPRLPFGLRERDGYYSYVNPVDGREYGLGRNKRDAIAQAIEANAALRKTPSLLDRINGNDVTWGDWCDKFEKLLGERDRSPNTIRTNKSQLNRLRRSFKADRAAKDITTAEIAVVLNDIKDEGKARTAQAFRAFLGDCFDRMIAHGVRKDNPARVTDVVNVKVKRARLSLKVFLQIYGTTELAWLRNAMALALVSGQDRDTCCHARFADFRDGYWWIQRRKTEARIQLTLDLRLDVFGKSLEDVVRQCRASGIVSAHLVHQTERAKGARLGKKMHIDTVTRAFSAEIDKLGLDWGGKSPPTFHEIRSLSTRLYEEQNAAVAASVEVSTRKMLGHTDESTTDIYRDGRGEWVKVNPRKPLPR
jgi:hypothetical protein